MDISKRLLLKETLIDQGLLALVVTSVENNYYLTGFKPFSKNLNPQVSIYSVVFQDYRDDKYVLPTIDLPSAFESGIQDDQVDTYGAFRFNDYSPNEENSENVSSKIRAIQDSPTDALAKIFAEQGLTEGNIAIEFRGLSGEELATIRKKVPNVNFIDGTSIIDHLRIIKTDAEIDNLKKASSIADTALIYTFDNLKIGMSELEANQIYRKRVIEEGGNNTFAVFTFSHRTAYSDTSSLATNKLSYRDIIRADVGCSFAGYHADMSRSAVMGNCDDLTLSIYKAILAGESEAIKMIKSGVKCSDVFNAAVKTTRNSGLSSYNRHHCGHGIGLFCHEEPLISSNNETNLIDGMVICIETPYYRLGWGGLQVEDTLLVRKNGCELLTISSNYLYLL